MNLTGGLPQDWLKVLFEKPCNVELGQESMRAVTYVSHDTFGLYVRKAHAGEGFLSFIPWPAIRRVYRKVESAQTETP